MEWQLRCLMTPIIWHVLLLRSLLSLKKKTNVVVYELARSSPSVWTDESSRFYSYFFLLDEALFLLQWIKWFWVVKKRKNDTHNFTSILPLGDVHFFRGCWEVHISSLGRRSRLSFGRDVYCGCLCTDPVGVYGPPHTQRPGRLLGHGLLD
jgi:hypothetical protein